MFDEVRALLGERLVKLAMADRRKKLGARLATHRDTKGRATPFLVLGTPRLGTIVWLHGFSDRIDTFLATAKPLLGDYEVVVPSMPAFGDGWVDPSETHTFEAYGRWLTEVLSDIAPARFHLAGNSLGGATSLYVARHLPERVASLVLVNSAGVRPEGVRSAYDEGLEGQNLFEVRSRPEYERFRRRVMANPPKLPAVVDSYLYVDQKKNADWYVKVWSDLGTSIETLPEGATSVVDLAALDVPTHVVWGTEDTLFPLAIGEHAARTIPGATLHALPGIGHCPHLESPRELARILASLGPSH
jgi:pimeloyl-ACP methyl ester carboxylesterase